MSKSYIEKLRNPRWQKKRLEILQRDNWACKYCGDTENTLHVHHRTYEKGKEPWEYENNNFITLCADCHELEEGEKKQYEPLFLDTFYKAGFFADDLRVIAHGIYKMQRQLPHDVLASAYSFAFSDPEMQELIINTYFNKIGKVRL